MKHSDTKLYNTLPTPYALYQSKNGKYFIGQTKTFGQDNSKALALLVNPANSGVNIYLNAISITNLLSNNILAEIFVNSKTVKGAKSHLVSSANLTIKPTPNPEGEIRYSSKATKPSKKSIPIFSRMVSPASTTLIDGGQIIIPPGQSIAVYIGKNSIQDDNVIVAFGWWEEDVKTCHSDNPVNINSSMSKS